MFPLFLILVLGMITIFIGGCLVYIQLYKRRVNKVLNGAVKKIMPAPFHAAIVLLIIVLIFAVFISFISGFGLAYRSLENKIDGQIDITAFYGEIICIDEHSITVKGLSINEKEYRDEFVFELHESMIIEWHNQPISLDELHKGDLIAIILVTDVAGIEDIFKIQLLRD